MRRKVVLRLIICALVSVILWILWFSNFSDSDYMTDDASQSFGSQSVNTKMSAMILNLPKDLASLTIPELDSIANTSKPQPENGLDRAVGLTFYNRVFYLNGQPFRIFSGAVHYFRIVPEYWEDRLKKLKACGLNTVETYVAWNLHEPTPGVFNYKGMLDLKRFIRLAAELGLYVILRPGPYICSEFEFGGLPGWLLHDPNMTVRSNYPGYVSAVNRYFSSLLPLVYDQQFTEGGPIIMFQVENEYSAFGKDTEHLKLLVHLMRKYGIKELLATSDHKLTKYLSENEKLDFSKYALPTDNFGAVSENSLATLQRMNKHFPVMVMEFWTGWFDVWGQNKHSTTSLPELTKTFNFILDQGGSFNLYMFIGGTNFGFTSGANNMSGYQSMVTSYDYDAILSEAGDITPKYNMIRSRLLTFYNSIGIQNLPPVPPNTPKADYGSVQVSEIMEWDVFISLVPIGTTDNKVNFMETYRDYDGSYNTLGYIVYSHVIGGNTHWNKMPGVQLVGFAKDRLTAVLNSETFFVMDAIKKTMEEDKFLYYSWDKIWQKDPYEYMYNYSNDYDQIFDNARWLFPFLNKVQEVAEKMQKKTGTLSKRLDLMVENLGRVNFSPHGRFDFNIQRKGIQGPVFRYIFDVIDNWSIRFINFNRDQCKILSKSSTWLSLENYEKRLKEKADRQKVAPTLYRAYLNIQGKPNDTFVKMKGWSKGVVVVNGFNLGRYWNIGPQKTLYLPAPLLKTGKNEILVFEEIKCGKIITFQNFPEL